MFKLKQWLKVLVGQLRSTLGRCCSICGARDSSTYMVSSLLRAEAGASQWPLGSIKRVDAEFHDRRESDTLFILGSGPSVMQWGEDLVKDVQSHDSVGFNFWVAHPFVPSFFVFQRPRSDRYWEGMKALFIERREDYANSEFLIRGDATYSDSLGVHSFLAQTFPRKKFWHLPEFPVSAGSPVATYEWLDFLAHLGLIGDVGPQKYVPKLGVTAGLLVALGAQMGYRNIVLAGLDMRNLDHFYEHDQIRQRFPEIQFPTSKRIRGTFLDGPSAHQRFIDLSKWFEKHTETRLWIADNSSALSPYLPVWVNK